MNSLPLLDTLLLWMDDIPRSAADNMSIDEALLRMNPGQLILRTYLWSKLSVSVGYRQDLPSLEDWPEYDRVRRWTGGGLVEHGKNDATYALVMPPDTALAQMRPRKCYLMIHQALSSAVAGNDPITITNHSSGNPEICFQSPVPGDILDKTTGEKIAGAAQRRTRSGILQQGSIQRSLAPTWGLDFAANLAASILPLSDSDIQRALMEGQALARERYAL